MRLAPRLVVPSRCRSSGFAKLQPGKGLRSPRTECLCRRDIGSCPQLTMRNELRSIRMNQTQNTQTAVGLDVGTSRIVTARQSEGAIEYNTQLNAFIAIPYSRMTENV